MFNVPQKGVPKGPKIEKIQDHPPGLKYSNETDQEPPTKPLFSVGNSESPGLKISIEIEHFKRNLRSCLLGTDPISGPRPEMGKNRKNIGFGLPEKIGKSSRKMGKMAATPIFISFGPFFLFTGNIFLFSRRGQNPHLSYIFSHFGPEARNGVCTRQTGSQSEVEHFKRDCFFFFLSLGRKKGVGKMG